MHLLRFQFILNFDKIAAKLQEIGNLRSVLSDKCLTVKQWQANELKFIDSKYSLLEDLTNGLQKAQHQHFNDENKLGNIARFKRQPQPQLQEFKFKNSKQAFKTN